MTFTLYKRTNMQNQLDMFDLKIFQSNGQEFENLFTKIMTAMDSSFRQVKPHGNIGDGGNDGFFSTGKYYQVYAPNILSQNISNAKKKIEDDFKKLISNWNTISPIRSFYFVVNDKYQGTPKPLHETISKIKNEYNLITAEIITPSVLKHIFLQLPEQVQNNIIPSYTLKNNNYIHDRDTLNRLFEIIKFDQIQAIKNEPFGKYVPRWIVDKIDEVSQFFQNPQNYFFNNTLEEKRREIIEQANLFYQHFRQHCVGSSIMGEEYFDYIDIKEFFENSNDVEFWENYSYETHLLAFNFCQSILFLMNKAREYS